VNFLLLISEPSSFSTCVIVCFSGPSKLLGYRQTLKLWIAIRATNNSQVGLRNYYKIYGEPIIIKHWKRAKVTLSWIYFRNNKLSSNSQFIPRRLSNYDCAKWLIIILMPFIQVLIMKCKQLLLYKFFVTLNKGCAQINNNSWSYKGTLELRIIGFVEFVNLPQFLIDRKHGFGNWICSRLQARVGSHLLRWVP
jgi:hypothetical protein